MPWEDQGVEMESADSSEELSYVMNSPILSNVEENSGIFSNSSNFAIDNSDHAHSSLINYSVYNCYFYGQIANVIKASMCWSMFGVIVTFFTESNHGISLVRLVFNLSIILSSPFASILAGRTNIKTILSITTVIRTIIWSIMVPLFWYYLDYKCGYKRCFFFNFLCFMFIDGLQVSFSNIVDIDCGGFDSLSLQYDVPLSYTTRYRLNTVHQIVFDLSFFVVSLPVAYSIYRYSLAYPQNETLAFALGMPIIFLLLGLISLSFYLFGLPNSPCQEYRNEITIIRSYSFKLVLLQRLRDIFEGFCITIQNHTISSRLLFLTIETAFDDSLISLIIPSIAIHNGWFQYSNLIKPNLIAVFLISLGKLGGVIGMYFVQRRGINVNSISRSYLKLSQFTLLSMLSILLLPASVKLIDWLGLKGWVCVYIFGLVFFLFFLFNSLPKVWLSTLLQNAVSDYQVRHKIYYFVSLFITLIDALVIIGLNYSIPLPSTRGYFLKMLYYAAGFYSVYGILQIFIGPFMLY
ncbi:conserved Plasmodium membrane protein, unknown function [Babesia microti strain RI]|uniref:Uncharacterized protein n=1 Tax=Babesia microti (strain RI) TaxID=1133968 RepID=A0A1N6LYC5_BABMR|nr:conserved Plasmodium membrane protein, unknown function [Babesia microti strain RI]SIO73873.1 conserved Plasmodium membrane protein, unknown function [Babesia microti strain RI]|eukprot:XP_021337925.1 conserved Plasmodium membrane protein, unknown function [Babesia microti strain RI]